MSIQGGNSIKDIDYLLMDNSQLGFDQRQDQLTQQVYNAQS